MESLTSIMAQVEGADTDAALLVAAGEAFEQIAAIADGYAIPGTPSFAAWSFVTVACRAGRDAVGYPPTYYPPELGGPARSDQAQGSDDDAAEVVSSVTGVLQRALAGHAETAVLPEDRQAFRRAAAATSEILALVT